MLFLTEVQIGTVESIEYLLSLTKNKKYLDYKAYGEKNPMLFAVLRGSTELIDYLLSLGFNFKINKPTQRIIMIQFESKHSFLLAIQQRRPVEFLDFLIERGCDLDSVNHYNQNAFLLAIITYSPFPDNFNDQPEILRQFFRFYNFNIDTFNNDRWNRLYNNNNNDIDNEKLKIRRKEVLQYLIKKGIKFRAKDNHHRNAIHYAAILRDLDLLQFFISLKINVKELDLGLQNAIHLASIFPPNLEMIKYLVSLKVSPSLVDAKNQSAIIITLSTYTRKLMENSNELLLKETMKEAMEYFVSKKSPITIWKRKQLKNDLLIELLKKFGDWEMIKFVYSLYSEKVIYPITFRPLQYIFTFDVRIYDLIISNNIDNEFIYPPPQNDENIIINPKMKSSKKEKKEENSERFSILHHLVSKFSSDTQNFSFKSFKKCFEYFLPRGNSINEPNNEMQIPIQILNFRSDITILWKLTRYLIDKGSNLHHVSRLGSIMHHLMSDQSHDDEGGDDYNENLPLKQINLLKFILVRSLDVNPFDQAMKKGVTGFKRKFVLQNHPVKKRNFGEGNNEDQKVEDEVISQDENNSYLGIWKNAFTKYVLYAVPPLLTIVGKQKVIICLKDKVFVKSIKVG